MYTRNQGVLTGSVSPTQGTWTLTHLDRLSQDPCRQRVRVHKVHRPFCRILEMWPFVLLLEHAPIPRRKLLILRVSIDAQNTAAA